MTSGSLLIADIGGTNARFALAEADRAGYDAELILRCSDFGSADDAIRHYLDDVAAAAPRAICVAAAGPVRNQEVRFTNNTWSISGRALQQAFDIDAVRLLNDFEAIAWCLPGLDDDELLPVGLATPRPLDEGDFTVGVVGPGTGLGTAGLRKLGNQLIPMASEAGHVGFAPETQLQIDILRLLRQRFDRVSPERLVSGPGIENTYTALCELHGDKVAKLTAAEIFAAAIEAGDPRATEAVELFYEILGQVAGDLVLSLGATHGVYICGGIAQRYPDKLQNSRFRSGFEAKGRYRTLLEDTPTQLVTHEHPGLLGAAVCVRQMLP